MPYESRMLLQGWCERGPLALEVNGCMEWSH